jgi:hypothetical protein
VQPLQQPQCLVGEVLAEQHPRQHEMFRLTEVAQLVVDTEAALLHPKDGRGDVALGEQQSSPLGRDGAQEVGHGRVGDLIGFVDRLQRAAASPAAWRIHASVTRRWRETGCRRTGGTVECPP